MFYLKCALNFVSQLKEKVLILQLKEKSLVLNLFYTDITRDF